MKAQNTQRCHPKYIGCSWHHRTHQHPLTPTWPPTSFLFSKYFAKYRAVAVPRSNFFVKGNVFTGVCLFTISLMATRSLLILVTVQSVHILLEFFLAKIFPKYRSGTLNLNMVNSKFHWIWSFFEIITKCPSFHVYNAQLILRWLIRSSDNSKGS